MFFNNIQPKNDFMCAKLVNFFIHCELILDKSKTIITFVVSLNERVEIM